MWYHYSLYLFLFSGALFASPLSLEVFAPCAILMNAETGKVLYEKQADTPCYPASITKIATALFLLDRKQVNLNQMVTVTSEALKLKPEKNRDAYPAHWLEIDGTRMGLVAGEKISNEALLYGLMLSSGNDAANVLAQGVCDSVTEFMEEMNGYVQELGCSRTQFRNPHGLHHPEHYTSAYDICLIAKKALSVPTFKEIVSKIEYEKPKTNKQKSRKIRHSNALLHQNNRFYYPKAFGIKTGYTSAAQNTLVAAAEHEGRVLLAVVLGCKNRQERYEDVIRLFNAAFREEKKQKGLFGIRHVLKRRIEGGNQLLEASLKEDLTIPYYPSEEPDAKAFVVWHLPELPIHRGDIVGELIIKDELSNFLDRKELYARCDVKRRWLSALFSLFSKKS